MVYADACMRDVTGHAHANSRRLLCFDGYANAFSDAKCPALRIRIVAEQILVRLWDHSILGRLNLCMIAIGAPCTDSHAKNVFTNQKDHGVEPIDAGQTIASNDCASIVVTWEQPQHFVTVARHTHLVVIHHGFKAPSIDTL